ncbi:AraC family transcriptional regulator [Pseudoduganella aquatica]|uniref:Helix-turn-helix domain-containing protein n=1 Tax=Pseudoduganella aquatica TaxID=2660641 RepID=A0A7X4KQ24_9BURK|nr:AraC family transcriptional regulator [Pseudoduganella aquatica]MYN09851.1 helix-turn-helix domain-containing protein [Pseudoduganella aquatica]
MDPLTDILSGLRIRQANFTRMDASAPWGVNSPGEGGVNFVLLVRGSAILSTPGSPQPIALRSGDVFIKLDDSPYRLVDREDSALIDCVEVEKLRVGNHIQVGGGGAVTTFISGWFALDALEAGPLMRVLPPLLCLKLDQHRSLAFQSVLEMLALETESPGMGAEAVVSRLFELLFVHAIRAYSMQPGGPTRGWLGAIADRNLALALEAMHGAPAQDWTVESLARTAGMSRSGFAARFKTVVGQSPLDYLTQWRMHCATRLLQQGNAALSEVARQVGYESVAAFNRVFRRETAMTPGAFRKLGLHGVR